jgi:hypothetical protein
MTATDKATGRNWTQQEHGAIHEAGHAVLAWYFGVGVKSIALDDDGDGNTKLATHDHGTDIEVMLRLAGGLADMAITGCDPGDAGTFSEDHPLLTDVGLAWELVERDHPDSDLEAAEHMALLESRTQQMVDQPSFRDQVSRLARVLLARRRLGPPDILAVLGPSWAEAAQASAEHSDANWR